MWWALGGFLVFVLLALASVILSQDKRYEAEVDRKISGESQDFQAE